MAMATQHLLSLDDLGADGIRAVIDKAAQLKADRQGANKPPLAGRTLGMLFEKASTRTRVSFEAGMTQLGGHAIFLSPEHTQIGRGETTEDTARVLSRMVDAVMIRNHSQEILERFAAYAGVPVINGLTDRLHPCQLLADILTYTEHRGAITDADIAWVGDGNNMCHSYLNAARLLGFNLHLAVPQGYMPDKDILQAAADRVTVHDDARQAVSGADLVVTDTWTSMGDEAARSTRLRVFEAYRVDAELMALAADDALFMHCLPAHRGEEVTAEVIDGPASVVWDEAENRLHAQNALLLHLLQPVADRDAAKSATG